MRQGSKSVQTWYDTRSGPLRETITPGSRRREFTVPGDEGLDPMTGHCPSSGVSGRGDPTRNDKQMTALQRTAQVKLPTSPDPKDTSSFGGTS